MRSTANDMLSFLAAQIKLKPSDLGPAIDVTKVEDAKITFESDGNGPATALILHQGGQDFRATRIAD